MAKGILIVISIIFSFVFQYCNSDYSDVRQLVQILNKDNFYQKLIGYDIITRNPDKDYLFYMESLDFWAVGSFSSGSGFIITDKDEEEIKKIIIQKNLLEQFNLSSIKIHMAKLIAFMIQNNIKALDGKQGKSAKTHITISLKNDNYLKFVGGREPNKKNKIENYETIELIDSTWLYCKVK